ncbi:winged helix-turn-helix transcriptional regulator [Xaviernesmea oryzae]|nr:winged helix-turn-helix transcriptional regulator [Xaviernesmea oryzae]SEM10645.1 hypothetical protein SAMN04487976_11969 [Xaviernesmea oryzae]
MTLDFAARPDIVKLLKLLSRPNGPMIVRLLDGKHTVNEISKRAQITQSYTSQILTELALHGVLDVRENGNVRYYKLTGVHRRCVEAIIAIMVEYAQSLRASPDVD